MTHLDVNPLIDALHELVRHLALPGLVTVPGFEALEASAVGPKQSEAEMKPASQSKISPATKLANPAVREASLVLWVTLVLAASGGLWGDVRDGRRADGVSGGQGLLAVFQDGGHQASEGHVQHI